MSHRRLTRSDGIQREEEHISSSSSCAWSFRTTAWNLKVAGVRSQTSWYLGLSCPSLRWQKSTFFCPAKANPSLPRSVGCPRHLVTAKMGSGTMYIMCTWLCVSFREWDVWKRILVVDIARRKLTVEECDAEWDGLAGFRCFIDSILVAVPCGE